MLLKALPLRQEPLLPLEKALQPIGRAARARLRVGIRVLLITSSKKRHLRSLDVATRRYRSGHTLRSRDVLLSSHPNQSEKSYPRLVLVLSSEIFTDLTVNEIYQMNLNYHRELPASL